MSKRFWALAAALFGVLLLGLGLGLGDAPVSGTGNQQGNAVLFSDTFTTMSPLWTVADLVRKDYEWGVVPYSRTVGADMVADQGFWAAGGGALGVAQSWPSGTYTNGMMTVATAGPFTLAQPVAEVRLSARVLNRIHDAGDQLIVALSTNGSSPLPAHNVAVAGDPDAWQEITRSAGPFQTGQRVWVFLLFVSDGSGVDAGPLIDDITLEAIYSHDIYLPVIRRDPTPTPLPIYVDGFTDPSSGWQTGWVQRFNEYCRSWTECYSRWEDVAYLSYVPDNYRIRVPMDWRGGGDVLTHFVWPAEMAPIPGLSGQLPDSYCVEARARFANSWGEYQPWWAHWGLVFGANSAQSGDALTEIYTFQINANHAVAMLRYHNYIYPGDRQPTDGTEINVEIPLFRWPGNASYEYWSKAEYGNATAQYNVLKVYVHGDRADFYVNGQRLGVADIGIMPRAGVGIIAGSFEITPVEVDFDYFRYDPTCSGF